MPASVLDRCYPDIDSATRARVIAPLTRVVHDRLDREPGPASRRPGEATWAGPSAWRSQPEDYPFQRVIRRLAVRVDRPTPLRDNGFPADDPYRLDAIWLRSVEARLREIWTRPLVVSINGARRSGLLHGDGPRERYESFVEAVLDPRSDVATAVERFAGVAFGVARTLTATIAAQQAEFADELAGRLHDDRDEIAAAFGVAVDEGVDLLELSAGDSHNGGRSVVVVRFSSGRRVVYKPRDTSCEAAWESIAAHCNDRYGTTLHAARTLPRNGWGWVEYVDSETVVDADDFMRACGNLAAVLYLLDARDMHFENIVATSGGPVPVDLETILHPDRIGTGNEPDDSAAVTLDRSVYGMGLLPLTLLGATAEAGHVDLGFLGSHEAGSAPFRSLRFVEPFTDRISLSLETGSTDARHAIFGRLGRDDVVRLGGSMADGFRATLDAVMADRRPWTLLLHATTADVRSRYLHNPTMFYGRILRATSGAEALHDRDLYDALTARVALSTPEADHAVVASEVAQLAVRDVPYFTVHSREVDVRDAAGRATGATVARTPLSRALDKVERLTPTVVAEQLQLLHSAFSARFPDNHLATAPPPGRSGRAPSGAPALPDLAAAIATTLVDTSRPDRSEELPRTWIGPLASAVADRPWPPGVLGYDLYSGRYGPALALAGAGRVLDSAPCRGLATQIFASTAELLDSWRDEPSRLRPAGWSAYTGTAGIVYALYAAGRLLDEPAWCRSAQDAVPLVLRQVTEDPLGPPDDTVDETPVDVIHGLSGVLLALTAVGGPHRSRVVDEVASRIVAGSGPRGVSDQSGFGHGAAGVAGSLAQALPDAAPESRASLERRISTLVTELRTFFVRSGRYWATARGGSAPAVGWCHGSAGIALALSNCLVALPDDEQTGEDLDTAIGSLRRDGFGRNLTWCHGDLGNHDILRHIASRAEPGRADELRRHVERIERTVLHPRVIAAKLADTHSRYSHTDSLLVGRSGVLLHLVQRIDPALRVSPITFSAGEWR